MTSFLYYTVTSTAINYLDFVYMHKTTNKIYCN